ncbi:MBL fold metallo-hydrolase [Saccharopolyspora sp. MS10]|uniref:MBL fold metallo-hydrolase n=1 Tax=Saccharopolyspora sp. MS10 TaxID=3385973 RepID=UPI00399EEA0C
MRVHHLNCGTMRTPGAAMICHVLLVETGNGLALVDTGFGLRDVAEPARRLGPLRHLIRPVLDAEETAARQVERLGFNRDDVRHVVLTHFDVDHIGGLADFPHARVHVTAAEAATAVHAPPLRARMRYRPAQWAHGPDLVEHQPDGEAWWGFAAARELTEVSPGIALLALPGHTPGHAAVAVDAGERWVLHAGDAFYHHRALDGGEIPRVLKFAESAFASDRARVRANHARLAELHRRAEDELRIICAHDPAQLTDARPASA